MKEPLERLHTIGGEGGSWDLLPSQQPLAMYMVDDAHAGCARGAALARCELDMAQGAALSKYVGTWQSSARKAVEEQGSASFGDTARGAHAWLQKIGARFGRSPTFGGSLPLETVDQAEARHVDSVETPPTIAPPMLGRSPAHELVRLRTTDA